MRNCLGTICSEEPESNNTERLDTSEEDESSTSSGGEEESSSVAIDLDAERDREDLALPSVDLFGGFTLPLL